MLMLKASSAFTLFIVTSQLGLPPINVAAAESKQSMFLKVGCVLRSLRGLKAPTKDPVDWQKANLFTDRALPSSYVNLVEQNKITNQLRRDFGTGKGLEFIIDSYDFAKERGVIPTQNGFDLQALYLKRLVTSV